MPTTYDVSVPGQNHIVSHPTDDQAAVHISAKSPGAPSRHDYHPDKTTPNERVLDFELVREWWLLSRFLFPTPEKWPRVYTGFASVVNLHNTSLEPDGFLWMWGQPVSLFHLNIGGRGHVDNDVFLYLQAHSSVDVPLPAGEPGKLYTALFRLRGDRERAGTGELDAWVSSDPSRPVQRALSLRGIKLLHRERKNGKSYVQRLAYVWDGGPYIIHSTRGNKGNKVWTHLHVLSLIGHDLATCLADEPMFVSMTRSVHKPGFLPDLGGAKATPVVYELPPVLLPPELGGVEPRPEPMPEPPLPHIPVSKIGVNGARLLLAFERHGSPLILTHRGKPIARVARES